MWLALVWVAAAQDGSPAQERAVAILAAADAHDGKTDKVVSECATCSLAMAGHAGHAVTHEGYTLHFCSDACRRNFQKDPAKGIDRMEKALEKVR